MDSSVNIRSRMYPVCWENLAGYLLSKILRHAPITFSELFC